MPTYVYTDQKTGLTHRSPRELSPEEIDQIFDQLAATAPSAAPPPVPTELLPPPPKEDTLLGTVGTTVGEGFGTLADLISRPGKATSGFIGGALKGGVTEGVRRATTALTTPNVDESFKKVLEEQGILKDNPAAQALLGFAGDVVIDPLNLLGGAGMVRRPLIAAAAKAGGLVGKAEQARQLARVATLTPLGEQFQAKVAPVVGEALSVAASKVPGLRRLQMAPELAGLKGTVSGQYAGDIKRLSEAQARASGAVIEAQVGKLLEGVDDQGKRLIQLALGDPTAPVNLGGSVMPASMAITQDLTLLDKAKEVKRLFDEAYLADVAAGVMPARLELGTEKFQTALNALSNRQRPLLEAALQKQDPTGLSKSGQQLYQLLRDTVTRKTPDGRTVLLYDPSTITFAVDPKTQKVSASISSRAKDYLPIYRQGAEREVQVFKAVRASMPEAQEKTQAIAKSLQQPGVVTDLGEMLQRRLQSSARARQSADLMARYSDEFGEALPASGVLPAGKAAISDTMLESLPEGVRPLLEGKMFPAGVVKDLERTVVRIQDPTAMEGVLQRSGKYFKGLVTSMNIPSYHLTNFVGNVANMYASGMDLDQIFKELWAANRTITGQRALPSVAFKGGATLDSQALIDAANRYGIIGDISGYIQELKRTKQLTPTAQRLMGQGGVLDPENPLFVGTQRLGQRLVEDPAKLALFRHEVAQGAARGLSEQAAIEQAVLKTKNVLFDYAELSEAERKFTPYALFYTWTRKNIPLQLANLATRPGRAAQQERLVGLASTLAGADPDWQSDVPSYLRPGAFVVPGATTPGGDPVLARARLPLYDLATLQNLGQNPLGVVGRMVAPAYRIPTELLLLKEQLTEAGTRPIYTGTAPASPLAERLGLTPPTPTGVPGRQSNLQRYLLEQVPLPTVARAILAPTGEPTQMGLGTRVGLAALGTQPTALTAELRAKRRKEEERAEKARQERLRSARQAAGL